MYPSRSFRSESLASMPTIRVRATDPTQEHATFEERRARLLGLLTGSRSLVEELRGVNHNHPLLMHSQSHADTASVGSDANAPVDDEEALGILNLDVRIGHLPTDLSSMDAASLAALLDSKLQQALSYLDKLLLRLQDNSSKVLVTGDVNAGKSTLVNSLLRREVCPVDQQPWTMAFCEMLDAATNEGKEEVHVVASGSDSQPVQYDQADHSTFERVRLSQLENVATRDEDAGKIVKVYVKREQDVRLTTGTMESILHNGAVDLCLIDGPGLNTDTLKTLATFARQEEIDVVVFVVNAENHFTLSGKEFLKAAGQDKAHVFIVVNKFDNIRDKERCKRAIMHQIREVSPHTYKEATDLVHFLSARDVVMANYKTVPPEFSRMERCLRWFTLEKRVRSKLAPVKRYLSRLLNDVRMISRHNRRAAEDQYLSAQQNLALALPQYEETMSKLKGASVAADDELEACLLEIGEHVRMQLSRLLHDLDHIGRDIPWPGFGYMLWYVHDIRNQMVTVWDDELKSCEEWVVARVTTSMDKIRQLGHPEKDEGEPAEALDRMFSSKKKRGTGLDLASVNVTDLVDVKERVGVVSTVSISSIVLMSGPLMSVRRAMVDAIGLGRAVGGGRRMLFIGLGLGILAGLWYLLGDVQHSVHRRIAEKLRRFVRDGNVLEAQIDRIKRRAAVALRKVTFSVQQHHQRQVEESEQRKQREEARLEEAKVNKQLFKQLSKQARQMKLDVEAVEVDTN